MQLIEINKKTINIDIVSDVVCPWCYIGKKRLESAINDLKNDYHFELNFHPFQLDATLPEAGIDQKTHFIKKFGSEERMEEIFSQVAQAGASVGIDFKFKEIPKAINTIGLHAILHVAKAEGLQLAINQALFEAYMVHPIDMSDKENIANVLAPFGWSKAKVFSILMDEKLKNIVIKEIQGFQKMGISGVPFFIINQKYGISGAQAAEVFKNAFVSMKEEDFPVSEVTACSVNGNC